MGLFRRRENNASREVTKADKVWLNSIVKRQYMVVDDLIKFSESYPDKIDREIVGSLFSIYEMLRDTNMSVQYAHGKESEETLDDMLAKM